jgi:hypothetical protein
METTLRRFPALIALAIVLAFTCPTMTLGQSATPDHVALSWTNSPATTMTVTWRTNTSVRAGLVEFGKGSTLSGTARHMGATSSDFTTDLGATRLFRATLANLSPNTQYCYRVGDGEHWSTARAFSTADPATGKVKFLVFGDSQSVPPYSTWKTTIHNAYKANPDAKFMVNVGDLVDVGQSGAHWNAWFAGAAGVIDTIPEMPVIGNHETTPAKGDRRPAYWLAQFTLPQNGPAGLKGQAYSYDYGPVHIAVLDSQQAEEKKLGDIFTPQAKWLDADLAASKATWKIVIFHKDVYELNPLRKSTDVKKAFCPILESHHADLVFNGHDHGIGRTYPIKNGELKRKPSEGTVYYVTGRSGSKYYSILMQKPFDAFFYNPLDQPNYLVVEIVGSKLTVRAVKQDGSLISTFFIDKAKDIDSDGAPR